MSQVFAGHVPRAATVGGGVEDATELDWRNVSKRRRPLVVNFFLAYTTLLGFLSLAVAVAGAYFLFVAFDMEMQDEAMMWTVRGVLLFGFGCIQATGYLAPLILPVGKTFWIFGLMILAISTASFVLMLFSGPLLVFWFQEPVRDYCGVN